MKPLVRQQFLVRNLVFITVITSVTTFSTKSFSIGSTEQGVLYGVFGTVLLQKIFTKQDNTSQYYPENPTGEFPPFRCSGNSVECSFQRGVWEKQHEEWLKAKDVAYRCGRYGECD